MELVSQDFKTPFGELILAAFNGELVLCDWKYRKMRSTIDKRLQVGLGLTELDSRFRGNDDVKKNDFQQKNQKVLIATKIQFNEYFARERTEFDLPIRTVGTDFQKRVWETLSGIPFGETRSYLQVSQELGNPKAIRAVASANGANALSILIPCHRIIGSNGELTGYAGGLSAKKKLLELENPNKTTAQLNLF